MPGSNCCFLTCIQVSQCDTSQELTKYLLLKECAGFQSPLFSYPSLELRQVNFQSTSRGREVSQVRAGGGGHLLSTTFKIMCVKLCTRRAGRHPKCLEDKEMALNRTQ